MYICIVVLLTPHNVFSQVLPTRFLHIARKTYPYNMDGVFQKVDFCLQTRIVTYITIAYVMNIMSMIIK